MKPSVLFLIASDPRTSPRPAEAIRIAAGVGTWKKVEIDIYLTAAAAPLLYDSGGGLIDDENFDRYLPIIGEWGRPIYVEEKGAEAVGSDQWRLPCEVISESRLAQITAEHRYVLRF